MIDFACKKMNIQDIVKCSLGLSRSDYSVMQYLAKGYRSYHATDEIAGKLGLNLSTVQRAVKKLYERNMLLRTQENLDGGGYVFLYRMKNKEAARKVVMTTVNNWAGKVESELCKW